MTGGDAAAGSATISQAGALARRAATLVAALGERFTAETDRWTLWLPVLFGCGIGAYFALAAEPPPWAAPICAGGALATAILGRARTAILIAAVAGLCVGLGVAAAQLRASWVAAPVLESRWGPGEVAGRVVAVEIRPEGRRITLDQLRLADLPAHRTPAQVRMRTRDAAALHPGERIVVRAVLMPPPAPAGPGAYDFQRQAWFDRLGAVGFTVGPFRPADADASRIGGLQLWLNAARQDVVERALAAVPRPAGAVIAALLTGEQGAVPPDVMAWMRDSGLAHLLSVSGLHVGLVAAIVFFVVRRSLALAPPIALRYPIKKWAAVAAFVAITLYMLFVTPGVPTQRAWLMGSVVLFAVLIDRVAISMRLVAWAGFAVLLASPESLLGPSFQMSFAAVVGLIAAWEASRERLAAWRAESGLVGRFGVAVLAAAGTSLVAGMASAPYALYHFNRFAAFGLAANLLAIPLTSLWVMPWAVAAFLLLPFGLESWALIPMGWGTDGLIAIAREVASWGGAVALLPAMPAWGLAAITLGGLWLCLWRTRWRLAGVPLILVGLVSIAFNRGPDILVSGDARLIAVRGADGALQLSSARAARLTRETWLRRDGQEADDVPVWPALGVSADGRLHCDASGCLYRVNGHVAALVRDAAALAEDCRIATAVVATVPVRRGCAAATVVVDRFALWRDGGHALWLDPNGAIRVQTVRAYRGTRPWVPPPPTPRARREARPSAN